MMTFVLFQPAAFGAGAALALMSGGVSSILTVATAMFDLPAWSVTFPVTVCALPSVVKVAGAEQLTISDTLGEQTKLTVTLLLFQPAAFGAGTRLALILGAVFSILSNTDVVAVFPALSLTLALMGCALPSVLTTCGAGQATTPDKLSEQV